MSTSSMVLFYNEGYEDPVIVYHHLDGYPSGIGLGLLKFLEVVLLQNQMGAIPNRLFESRDRLAAWYIGQCFDPTKSFWNNDISVGRYHMDCGYKYEVICSGGNKYPTIKAHHRVWPDPWVPRTDLWEEFDLPAELGLAE